MVEVLTTVVSCSVAGTEQVLHTLDYLERRVFVEANLLPSQEEPTERAVAEDLLGLGESPERASTNLRARFPAVDGLQVSRTSTTPHMDAAIFGRSFSGMWTEKT